MLRFVLSGRAMLRDALLRHSVTARSGIALRGCCCAQLRAPAGGVRRPPRAPDGRIRFAQMRVVAVSPSWNTCTCCSCLARGEGAPGRGIGASVRNSRDFGVVVLRKGLWNGLDQLR